MSTLFQDLKYGLRMLGRSPGFTAVAVLTLALGIGANTAIFSVVNTVLLRPLPYPQPDQIVQISRTYRGQIGEGNFNAAEFQFWKDHSNPFQYLAADTFVGFNLAGISRAERVKALRVSVDYFHVLGIRPSVGRDFLPEEDRAGGPNVAILSNGIWRQEFGADPQVIGHTILLDGDPYTIIGVMPSGFESFSSVHLWTTIGQVANTVGVGGNYELLARLKPGVSRRQADSYLATTVKPYLKEFARAHGMSEDVAKDTGIAVFSYRYMLTSDKRTPLLVLFSAIGFVLLIACANVANLQMARAATRNREIAVRTALGAGRLRLLRQLLTENVLLALLGAALGLLVAQWALRFLVALTPTDLPRVREIALDRWALGFTALVAVFAGILFGLAPAFQASQTDLGEALKESGGRSVTRRHRLGAALVAGEVALSLLLLVGSGLLIQTFANLLRVDPGFDPRHTLSLQIWTTGFQQKSAGALADFYEKALRRIETIPGVEKAAVIAAGLPLEYGGNTGARVLGQKDSKWFSTDYREITPGYFRTLGVPLHQGRFFTEADSSNASKVVIINAALARKHFPDRSPIGEHLAVFELTETEREIVGVVGDVKSYLYEPAPESIFIPVAQASYASDQLFQSWFPTCVLVRTTRNPLGLSHAVEGALRDLDANLPIGEVRSMEQVLSLSIAFQRFLMTLMAVFAGMALVLAAVGVYGVMSYSVSQRTHEVGVRMALGATRGNVLAMVVWQGLRLALIGTALGLVGALALTRLLESMLFGVKPTDPVTFLAVSLLLTAVASLASYVPARRATKVDPIVALRYE